MIVGWLRHGSYHKWCEKDCEKPWTRRMFASLIPCASDLNLALSVAGMDYGCLLDSIANSAGESLWLGSQLWITFFPRTCFQFFLYRKPVHLDDRILPTSRFSLRPLHWYKKGLKRDWGRMGSAGCLVQLRRGLDEWGSELTIGGSKLVILHIGGLRSITTR